MYVLVNTFIATAAAVSRAGYKIKFVDINKSDGLMDYETLLNYKIKEGDVVIPVHLFGSMLDVKILKKGLGADVKIIEDASQARGATFKGDSPGKHSYGATYSFYPGKNLGAFGDGDNNVEPESVNRLINYSINENLEFVLGKRIGRPDLIIRRVITFILDLNLRLRFNVKFKDTNAGIRIHSNSFLKSINLNNLNNLKIPNALITTFAFYLNVRTSNYPVIMRNNIKEQRKGEQWGSGVGLKSKIKLLRGGIICFYEVNTKFSNILIKNKGYC